VWPGLTTLAFNHLIGNLLCSRASDYGLMKIDDAGRILYFNEKPKGETLKKMVHDQKIKKSSSCCSTFPPAVIGLV